MTIAEKMDVKLSYIGVGVNRVVNALAWGEHGGVAYAAHHMIALYDVDSARVTSTISGHSGMVNCLLWIPREATPCLAPNQHLLLSGSVDTTVRCWLVSYNSSAPSGFRTPPAPVWRCLAVLQGHTAPVTSLAVHALTPPRHEASSSLGFISASDGTATGGEGPQLLCVSTAGDADVIVWSCRTNGHPGANEGGTANNAATEAAAAAADQAADGTREAGASSSRSGDDAAVSAPTVPYGQGGWSLNQRIHVGTRMQTTAALTHLPLDPDWTLLATGGTDRRISLYVRPPGPSSAFVPACSLEGHENWVRGVAFCHVAPSPPASASASSADAPEGAGPGRGGAGAGEAELPLLLLASVSQDRYGRIWKLQPEPLGRAAGGDAGPAPAPGEDPLAVLIQRYAPKPHIDTPSTRYVATCEALLIGHEDWVHGLQWAPPPPPPAPAAPAGAPAAPDAAAGVAAPGGGRRVHTRASAALLTASMDRTMIIWQYEASSRLWMNEASLGDAGASCLGYFGGVWGPGSSAILAHGFTGALHLWCRPTAASTPSPAAALSYGGPWLPYHALGGHFGPVVDLGWGLDGGCVISVSEDQTARVHTGTLWRRTRAGEHGQQAEAEGDRQKQRGQEAGAEKEEEEEELHWCEIARAQVHGHDFRCVAPVPTPPGSDYVYVSGSEEKVLRVFEAPQAFIDSLVALRGGEGTPAGRAIAAEGRQGHSFGAAVAALGLSNKAVERGDAQEGGNAGVGSVMSGGDYNEGPDFVPCATPQVVTEPPLEEHLAQNTLWPETHKLYGHGNDVFCAAASPDGRHLASACKAQTASTATIWVWCTRTWRALAQLKAHTLTVTQLEWSPSGAFLAAASRDRTFSIFRRTTASAAATTAAESGGAPETPSFELVHRAKAAHGRVIWSVGWSLDERLIATASRDDTVKIWWSGLAGSGPANGSSAAEPGAGTGTPVLAATLPQFPVAATAVAFAPRCPASPGAQPAEPAGSTGSSETQHCQLLAVGLEDGAVQLWRLTAEAGPGAPGGGFVCTRVWTAGEAVRHVAPVRRLRWRGAPGTGGAGAGERQEGDEGAAGQLPLQLASASEDHSVRVFTVPML